MTASSILLFAAGLIVALILGVMIGTSGTDELRREIRGRRRYGQLMKAGLVEKRLRVRELERTVKSLIGEKIALEKALDAARAKPKPKRRAA